MKTITKRLSLTDVQQMIYDCKGNDQKLLSLFEGLAESDLSDIHTEIVDYDHWTKLNVLDLSGNLLLQLHINNY